MVKIKPKVSKEELSELAHQTVQKLIWQAEEYNSEINSLQAKIDDNERKVRWLKREILD